MEKLHVSTFINAPVAKVWQVMFDLETYKEWTSVFNPGGYYEGSWEEGSDIKFLGPDPGGSGEIGGMFSKIRENRLHEFVSIEHVGIIHGGEIDTTSEEVKKWTPAFENYTFMEKDGGTELTVDMDIAAEHKQMFEEAWPKALEKIKELAEK